ncbi:CMGC family protein kinase [Histomonas meleagridis]|uniref:CMGC family protein kinase n=1 Tax=Histomonas meleagridis TaxID=135588 RepID=UPI00355A7698|nr:CMGC family protein kinase [Histomonas meleagridis]KAH0804635.1 CMGC family protein kinase [Histomonas meleagridis]
MEPKKYSPFQKHAEYDKIPGQDPFEQRKILKERPNIPDLKFGKIIGHGNFSHVYEGFYKNDKAAIKVIERGSPRYISNEIEINEELRNIPHIPTLLNVFYEPQTIMVFEFVDTIPINNYFETITLPQIRTILRCTLEALSEAHKHGIVHRDVKIGNILVKSDFSDVFLIDWGSGAFISDSLTSKAGSRSSRSPEMLLGYRNYKSLCDIWAIGILILHFLTNGSIPWKARSSRESICLMSRFYGRRSIEELANNLNLKAPSSLADCPSEPVANLESEFKTKNPNLNDANLIDLMKQCLSLDPKRRPTAKLALSHPFFV